MELFCSKRRQIKFFYVTSNGIEYFWSAKATKPQTSIIKCSLIAFFIPMTMISLSHSAFTSFRCQMSLDRLT